MTAIGAIHLFDRARAAPVSVCGIAHPPGTDDLSEATCRRCVSMHERRMDISPEYRESWEPKQ